MPTEAQLKYGYFDEKHVEEEPEHHEARGFPFLWMFLIVFILISLIGLSYAGSRGSYY